MTYRTFWKILTRLHRWAGLILGVQITIWFASGFFMSAFSIDKVRGAHLADRSEWAFSETPTIPITAVLERYRGTPERVTLRSVVGLPVYEVKGDGKPLLIDGRSGDLWGGLDAASVTQAAKKAYLGSGLIKHQIRLTQAPIEYRSTLPVWQVEFKDRSKTRLYIDAQTGSVKAVRTRLWRAFDFMWMLHIMDYKNRDNINLIWLKLFSFAALLFALSGLALVFQRFWLRPKAQ